MVKYNCYIDKEASTYFDSKIRDKDTGKKVILKLLRKSDKLSYKLFSLWHSSDKGINERDGKVSIVIYGTKIRETKSAIYVSIGEKDERYEISKSKE